MSDNYEEQAQQQRAAHVLNMLEPYTNQLRQQYIDSIEGYAVEDPRHEQISVLGAKLAALRDLAETIKILKL